MFKISLMDRLDLEDAYKIELETNPSPWSKDNFFSSYEVGHKSLVCKYNDVIIGFLIFSLIKKESHLLNIAVQKNGRKRELEKS
jgi:ribosomal protein S18 acetylase RimI-like enzyme